MTRGTIDDLKIGHILHYVYLFLAEAAQGRDEGVNRHSPSGPPLDFKIA